MEVGTSSGDSDQPVSVRKKKRERTPPIPNSKDPGVSDEATTVAREDMEMEEFFAILRRMHDAVKMMPKPNPSPSNSSSSSGDKNKKNNKKKSDTSAFEWRPAFRLEDFGVEIPRESDLKRSRSGLLFDLNSLPEE